MLSVGAASSACERPSRRRSWGGFGESDPLRTATHIRLSVQFFHEKEPTCSLAVWACVVPPSAMQHAVFLGRESGMRFNTRSYRALPPRPLGNRILGELTLSHHATIGEADYAVDPAASNGAFHLRYDGTTGVTLSDEPQLLAVNLVRSNGSPALTGHYFCDIFPQPDIRGLCCFRTAGASLNRCRGPRARRPCRGRRRPISAHPAGCLATPHPRCGTPPWPDFGQPGLCGRAFD